MDPLTAAMAAEVFRGVQAGIGWLIAKRGGDTKSALAILTQYQNARDKDIFGEDISHILTMTASGVAFLTARGMEVDKALALIDRAKREDRDLTDDEVATFFAETDAVAERVEDALADLENEEAGGDGESDSGAVTEDDSSDAADTGEDDSGNGGDDEQPDENPPPDDPPETDPPVA